MNELERMLANAEEQIAAARAALADEHEKNVRTAIHALKLWTDLADALVAGW